MIYLLKIDIDSKRKEKSLAKYIASRLQYIRDMTEIKIKKVDVTETMRGYHIKIEIETQAMLDNKDIVILQLIMGSDWRREVYNWLRVRASDIMPTWNVLFSGKFRNNNLVVYGKTEKAKKIEDLILSSLEVVGNDNQNEKRNLETVSD